MQYLLVAADKSVKLPIDIPDEIIINNCTSKRLKPTKLKASKTKFKTKRNTPFSKNIKNNQKQTAQSLVK